MNKLLFTGASGFLGENIIPKLEERGYSISTLGNNKGDYVCDLSGCIPILKEKFDIILHAAGKAHTLPKTEKEKQLFFEINFQGTKNLCYALEKSGIPETFVFISTVSVYGVESGININENHQLNGNSPYALSKIMAEDFLFEWCNRHNVNLNILRPSLIAGFNPNGNLGAMIQGIERGRYLRIGDGGARKSILMADDIAVLIPLLEKNNGVYNLCDNYNPSFAEIERIICKQLDKLEPQSIPLWVAKSIAFAGDVLGSRAPINSNKLKKIIQPLTFDNSKAVKELGWKPIDVISNFKIKK
jgi:nucleoside-diphosphate-sugar epimerase